MPRAEASALLRARALAERVDLLVLLSQPLIALRDQRNQSLAGVGKGFEWCWHGANYSDQHSLAVRKITRLSPRFPLEFQH